MGGSRSGARKQSLVKKQSSASPTKTKGSESLKAKKGAPQKGTVEAKKLVKEESRQSANPTEVKTERKKSTEPQQPQRKASRVEAKS